MSRAGSDQDMADALLADCGLLGCAAQPGEPCVNSVSGRPRDEPHWNRVVRGRRANTWKWRHTPGGGWYSGPDPAVQYGCQGEHHGRGTPDCPADLHHHHDERCVPPTATETSLSGVDHA